MAFEKREDAEETQSGSAEATGAREDEDPYLEERRVETAGADSSLTEGLLTSSLAGVNSLSLKSSRVTLASLAREGSTDLLRRP